MKTALDVFESKDKRKYLEIIQMRAKRHWHPHSGLENETVAVSFNVNKVGEISNINLSQPSLNEEANRLALRAVRVKPKLRPLPDGFGEAIVVEIRFGKDLLESQLGVGHGSVSWRSEK